jgi:hypothetical protein
MFAGRRSGSFTTCDRRGRYSVAKLLEQQRDAKLADPEIALRQRL